MVETSELEKLRPLGLNEKYFANFNQWKFYYNAGVTGYYILEAFASVASLEATVFAALAIVIAQHPTLSVIPVNEDSNAPYFARLPPFDLENAVTFVERQRPYDGNGEDSELDTLLETPHNEPFENTNNDAPYWRLMILTNPAPDSNHAFTASFIYHCAIGAGTSGMVFHRDFLAALNTSPEALPSPVVEPPKTTLLPPLEKILPLPVSFSTRISMWFLSRFGQPPQGMWAGQPITLNGTRCFQSYTLSPQTTTKFKELCHQNSTTIQAAMQVILGVALFKTLDEKFTQLRCIVPVNLTRWLPDETVPDNSMGVWISSSWDNYDRESLGPGFSWDEARKTHDTLLKYLEARGKNDQAGLLKYKNFRKFFWGEIGKPRSAAYEISNLGVFAPKKVETTGDGEGEEWKMGRMVFSQSAPMMHSAIFLDLVTGGDGGLTLGWAWQDTVVERKTVMDAMALTREVIEELVDGPEDKALPAIPEQEQEEEEEEHVSLLL